MKVSQPTLKPTNKLSAAAIAAAVIELAWVIVSNFWPQYADPNLKAALTPLVVFAVAYFVKDEANVDLAQDMQ